MAVADELNLKLDELNEKTNQAAERLREVIGMVQQGSMSQTEKDAIIARITAEADRLGTWGTDPANPLPST